MELIDNYCKEQSYYADIAGMCVSARGENIDFKGAYGYSNYEKKIPMKSDAMFPCASIAKLVTADLVFENLEISEDIVHLLSHTTGISEEGFYLWEPSEYRFSYDDAGYDRLGNMLEKKTGVPYKELAEKKLLEYGMENSSFSPKEVVSGHYKDSNRNIVRDKRYRYEEYHLPSSGLISNIYELDKLADNFMDGEKYKDMFESVADVPASGDKMGLGFFIWQIGDDVLYGHDAGDYGYRGTFWVCPERKINITVLANQSGASLRKIAEGIFMRLKNDR